MKIKFLFAVFCVCAFSIAAFSQSVVVKPKKITYKRKNPDAPDYKKTFTITYPKISGVSASLAKKIESNLSYEKLFDFSLKDEIETEAYLYEAVYETLYNKNGILNIVLSEEVSAAYPSTYEKSVVVNLKTGEKVKPQDVFLKLGELAAQGGKSQQKEIKKAIADIKKENPDEENPASLFENATFTIKDLDDFSVSDKGITFRYDYGFPHVILALQPEGRYFFSWAQLKPFIRRDGLLAKFIR
ncbi:MAG: hypothetical protein M3Q33_02180 [Acidobacteriota bacterium]|nr:hypothetical protein [Acidobacteriota bacterium]